MNDDMLWEQWWGPRKRNPRVDDPDHYRWNGEWVKRTKWTADNVPHYKDHDAYMRFLTETTEGERRAILTQQMRRKGLVAWRNAWVTPERAKELERRFQAGAERARRVENERVFNRPRYPVLWC